MPFEKIANFSGHNRGWWCKLVIENISSKEQNIVVQVGNQYIHAAKFHNASNNYELFDIAGTMIPINKRSTHGRYANGRLKIPAKSKEIVLISLKKSSLIKLPIRILEASIYERISLRTHLGYGIYFGFIIVLFLYATFFAVSLKSRMLYEYAAYLLAFGFMVFCLSGFNHRFLMNQGRPYVDFIYQDTVSLVLITMTFFGISFLNLRKNLPRYAKYLELLLVTYTCLYVILKILTHSGVFENYISVLMYQQYFFIIIFFVSLFAAGVVNLKYDKNQSMLYLLAYGSLLVAIVFSIVLEFVFLTNGNFNLDFSLFYEGSYMVGSTLEIFFFTVGISKYIRNIDNQRTKLGEELIVEKVENTKKLNELKNIVIKNHIILKDKTKVYIADLMYIKSDDHYLNIYLSDSKDHFVRGKLNQIKTELPPNFVQCHRSYIVNSNFIKQVNGDSLTLIDKTQIPLSRSYKDKF